MFKHHCRKLISFFALAFLQCKILLLSPDTKSMNLDTMPCVYSWPSRVPIRVSEFMINWRGMMISHGIFDVSTGLDVPAQSSVLTGSKLDTQDCKSHSIIGLTSNERQMQWLYYFSNSDNKKRVLKDFRWFIRHHSSVVESATHKKFSNP